MRYLIIITYIWLILPVCVLASPPAQNVSGTYMMKHADGQIEVWILRANHEFDQAFYKTALDYSSKKPFLEFQNRWFFKDGTALPVIEFARSYSLLDYGTWKIMNEPKVGTGVTAMWVQSNNGKFTTLQFFADVGYIADRK